MHQFSTLGAPPSLWAEAMSVVAHVCSNLAVCPDPSDPGNFLSRTALLGPQAQV